MARVAVDFGTSNTVLARYNETLQRAETIEIPGISRPMRYRLAPEQPEQVVQVIPSLIHYSDAEVLIGEQVLSRGLAEHDSTFRWMKRYFKRTRRKRTPQGHIAPGQAGADFLGRLLSYASDQLSLTDDEFTFTAPVEAFEDFQDWLRRVCEGDATVYSDTGVVQPIRVARLRLIDEPTACILGYQGAMRQNEHFLVFDFGGGTLDASAVRIDLSSTEDKKAIQLGQAGCNLGGMDLDQWIAEDFGARHRLSEREKKELEAAILRQAEEAKILLSDPAETDADLRVINDVNGAARSLRTTCRRGCSNCTPGAAKCHNDDSCLGCLLIAKDFQRQVRETVDRALENATAKMGMRRDDLVKVVVTGGTSLVPCVRKYLAETFAGRAVLTNPFDAVVRGACQGIVAPILQHDYAIESYHRDRKEYEFKPLFPIGTEYPTEHPKKLWLRGAYAGQTRIGLGIFEVSRMKRRQQTGSLFGEDGALKEDTRVQTDHAHICLNPDNPTFVLCDPPANLERDKERFLAAFRVDGNRVLRVTVDDNLTGKPVLNDHPVVRL